MAVSVVVPGVADAGPERYSASLERDPVTLSEYVAVSDASASVAVYA